MLTVISQIFFGFLAVIFLVGAGYNAGKEDQKYKPSHMNEDNPVMIGLIIGMAALIFVGVL